MRSSAHSRCESSSPGIHYIENSKRTILEILTLTLDVGYSISVSPIFGGDNDN